MRRVTIPETTPTLYAQDGVEDPIVHAALSSSDQLGVVHPRASKW
jgi:hypothetical protein